MEKTQPSGLNGYIPGYIPRPTLIMVVIFFKETVFYKGQYLKQYTNYYII